MAAGIYQPTLPPGWQQPECAIRVIVIANPHLQGTTNSSKAFEAVLTDVMGMGTRWPCGYNRPGRNHNHSYTVTDGAGLDPKHVRQGSV